jgi:hypothetical protein
MEKITANGIEAQGFERVLPLYLDSLTPDYILYRFDGGDTRWYYRPDTRRFYPSVTSVISATMPTPYALIQYLKNHPDPDGHRDERANYGTFLHIQIARLLMDGEYDLDALEESAYTSAVAAGAEPARWQEDAKKDLLAFAAFAREHSVKPIAIECVLCSDKGYAGAIDLVCEMRIGSGQNGSFLKRDGDGKKVTAIVDMKSGRKGFYENHEIQLHMYRDMWGETFPGVPVERVFNWAPTDWRTAPSWKLKDQTSSSSARKIPHLIELFSMSGQSGPSPRLVVQGKITKDRAISECYRFEDAASVLGITQ